MVNQRSYPPEIKMNFLNRWSYVISGILIMLCLGTVYSYSVFRLSIETEFNIGSTLSGLPYMTSLAFYALFMFFSGKRLDRHSPRNVILVGGWIVALGWILASFSQNIIVFTVTYGVISGSGVGIVYGVPMTVVAKWFPEKKGLAVGIVLVGFGLSPLLTAPLAKYIVAEAGVMNTFLILGLCFGIMLSLLSFTLKYPPLKTVGVGAVVQEGHIVKALGASNMVKSKAFWGLYLNFAIGTMIGLMLIGLTGSVASGLFNIPIEKVPLYMSLFAIFNGIGRPIFGWLTDTISAKKAMLISYGLIMSAAGSLLFFDKSIVLIYVIAFSIFWFNLGGWLAIAPATTLAMFGTKHYSKNYGVVFTGYGIGAILGVISSGAIIDILNNYNYLFVYVIALCVVGVLITLTLFQAGKNCMR